MSLPDEKQRRFIAILNKKVPMGRMLNAFGHMTAGLGYSLGDSDDVCFINYEDADGGNHPNISHYPFIVLKADNSNKIRKAREECLARNIKFGDFTSTMVEGTSQEQQDITKQTPEEELEYYGLVLFGDTEVVSEFTRKFSLFS